MAKSVCYRWSAISRRKSTSTSLEYAYTRRRLSLRTRALRSNRTGEARGGGLQLLHLQQVRVSAFDRAGRPIQSFYIPRSHPDGVSVNARCIDSDTIESISVKPFDGRDWEAGRAAYRDPATT